MNSLILRLFFHGLIAFAPDGPGGMDAYLVKHEGHIPVLMFEMTRSSICPAVKDLLLVDGEELPPVVCFESELQNGSSWCVCYVGGNDNGGVKISFQPSTVGPTRPVGGRPEVIRPGSALESAEFSWLVRMANVQDGTRVPIKDFKDIKGLVSARTSFKWLSERSCHLDQLGTPGCYSNPQGTCEFRIYPFEFSAENGDTARHRQALSEYVSFELRLAWSGSLVLEHEADPEYKVEDTVISLGCGARECPDVLVANLWVDQGSSSGMEGHFVAYYNLAQGMPKKRVPRRVDGNFLPFQERQLFTCLNDPLRRFGNSKYLQDDSSPLLTQAAAINLRVLLNALITAAETRIICPMAMFDRELSAR